jgi:hypothetical protein
MDVYIYTGFFMSSFQIWPFPCPVPLIAYYCCWRVIEPVFGILGTMTILGGKHVVLGAAQYSLVV